MNSRNSTANPLRFLHYLSMSLIMNVTFLRVLRQTKCEQWGEFTNSLCKWSKWPNRHSACQQLLHSLWPPFKEQLHIHQDHLKQSVHS